MSHAIPLESFVDGLVCPRTGGALTLSAGGLAHGNDPRSRYPIVAGIPVLLNEGNSLFDIRDYLGGPVAAKPPGLKGLVLRFLPDLGANPHAEQRYRAFSEMLPEGARILVVGGGVMGRGLEQLYRSKRFTIIGTDVQFGPSINLICDAHDLPFRSGYFDGVIIQAVLEHVLDPQRCVQEIHRVLKSDGAVYAETPFMQQVHMRQYDFTRFTHLGHRRLFRDFSEVDSGPTSGSAMALAWSYEFFLRSLTTRNWARQAMLLFARLTSFWLLWLDRLIDRRPGSYDAASGFYFLGRRSSSPLPDRELIKQFKGL